jgi:hypothetical protein
MSSNECYPCPRSIHPVNGGRNRKKGGALADGANK